LPTNISCFWGLMANMLYFESPKECFLAVIINISVPSDFSRYREK
jgi:hypothetical protein